MVALQVFLTEPLDSARLADVQVRAVATVVASIRLPQFDEPPRLPAGGVFSLDQPAIMYSAPITAGRAGIALPQQTALTGADGSAEFVWDESPGSPARKAWDDLGPLVAAGGSRFFRFSAGASLGGVVLPIIDLPGTADTGEAIAQFVGVDLATAIVGHVTDSSARLWFRFHPDVLPAGHSLHCRTRLAVAPRRLAPLAEQPVTIADDWARSGIVDVVGLAGDSAYAYDLLLRAPSGEQWRLTGGEFRTAPAKGAAKETIRIAFASCHKSFPAALERWRAMDDFHADVTLLVGDQLYGDNIKVGPPTGFPPRPAKGTEQDWFDAYSRGYVGAWSHHAMRNALRRRATYMMADDHDVADDWGVTFSRLKPTAEVPAARLRGALHAYHAFQQAHNPPGRSQNKDWTVGLDYGFDWGPVAAYVLDLRTRRGIGAGSPILGADQIVRFQTWASTVASQADVVVLASPVPLAFVDVSALTEALKAIKLAGEVAGYVGGFPGAGAVLGGIFGGGAGAFLGWEAGSWLQSKVDEIEEVDGRITEPDLADQWSDPLNQSDLGVVLDTLFGLANDAARPKAVIVISGDVHLGAIHEIRSSAAVGAHSRHQVLYQFTSSPIGAAPAADLLGPLTAADLAGISNPNDWFNLCTTPIATYSARIVGGVGGLLATRNFGTLVINPKTSANTVDVRASIRSAGPRVPPFLTDTLEMSLTYDLTAVNPPRPTFPVITPVRRRQ